VKPWPTLMETRRKADYAWTRQRILDLLAIAKSWNGAAKLARMDRTNLRRLARKVGAL